MINEKDLVVALYRGCLGRDPEPDGLAHHVALLQNQCDLAKWVNSFVDSTEARLKRPLTQIDFHALAAAVPMHVDMSISHAELDDLWAHTASVWSSYGDTEPFWSVLTHEDFLTSNAPTEETIARFYASGSHDCALLKSYLDRAELSASEFSTTLEYGCGVGRVTHWLAQTFSRVRALDISLPHLQRAKKHLSGRGLNNVDFIHVKGRADLSALEGIDLFFSVIVLQHNPPPIILDILQRAFAGLNRKGVAYFQVPTHALEYNFDLHSFWNGIASQKTMEMHFVPQRAILSLAAEMGMRPLEIRQDHWVGNYDRWVSSTYLMQKV